MFTFFSQSDAFMLRVPGVLSYLSIISEPRDPIGFYAGTQIFDFGSFLFCCPFFFRGLRMKQTSIDIFLMPAHALHVNYRWNLMKANSR